MTSEANRGDQQAVVLKLLQGKPPTPDLLRRWRRYIELPALVHARIWEVLNPILLGLPQESVPQHVAQFAAAVNVEVSDLTLALEGCHALLLEATARNIDVKDFNEDLALLSGAGAGQTARAAIVEGYERSNKLIRQRLVMESVAEHGKVLTGLNWRIDRILMSNHGFNLDTPILMMTLHYEDAGEKQHMTFQVSDSVLTMMRDFCDKMLKLGAEAPSEEEIIAKTQKAEAERADGGPS